MATSRKTDRKSAPRKAAPARRPSLRPDGGTQGVARTTLYMDPFDMQGALDELIPELLSVVAPHVELLDLESDPYAALLSERLRRSLLRLEPLLDETLTELQVIRDADVEVAATAANLRDSVSEAADVLRAVRPQKDPAAQPTVKAFMSKRQWSWRTRQQLLKWEVQLTEMGTKEADRAARNLGNCLRAHLTALEEEMRAHVVLQDAHEVLRHALMELARIGRQCEEAFPQVAQRVVPRPIEFDVDEEPVSPFDVQ